MRFPSATGAPSRGATAVGAAVCDQHGGALMAMGILGALLRREREGKTTRVESSLLNSGLDLQTEPLVNYFAGQVPQDRFERDESLAMDGVFTGALHINTSAPQHQPVLVNGRDVVGGLDQQHRLIDTLVDLIQNQTERIAGLEDQLARAKHALCRPHVGMIPGAGSEPHKWAGGQATPFQPSGPLGIE